MNDFEAIVLRFLTVAVCTAGAVFVAIALFTIALGGI